MKMKIKTVITAALLSLSMMVGTGFAAENQPVQPKILIAYFSRTGNTKALAEQIHQNVGGDLFEIKTVEPYPTDYDATTEVAEREKEASARPALSTQVNDMKSYDVVFVGYPIWFQTIPMAIASFLEQYDFSGKTIIPFCTYGRGLRGSGLGESASDIAKLCPKSEVREALALFGSQVQDSQNEVTEWLHKIGFR
jgi:flavodoxin